MDAHHSQRDLIMADDVKVGPSAKIWFCKNLLSDMDALAIKFSKELGTGLELNL